MRMSSFSSDGAVFVTLECVEGFAFRNGLLRDNYALLPVVCADFAHVQDHYAHSDPIERLSPHRHSA